MVVFARSGYETDRGPDAFDACHAGRPRADQLLSSVHAGSVRGVLDRVVFPARPRTYTSGAADGSSGMRRRGFGEYSCLLPSRRAASNAAAGLRRIARWIEVL